MMRAGAEWMERHQVPLYLATLVLGAAVGLLAPAVSHPAELRELAASDTLTGPLTPIIPVGASLAADR